MRQNRRERDRDREAESGSLGYSIGKWNDLVVVRFMNELGLKSWHWNMKRTTDNGRAAILPKCSLVGHSRFP